MKPPYSRRALWLAGSTLIVILLGMSARRIDGWWASPTFTLFVHSQDAADDPTRIIASVHASRASAWRAYRGRPETAEKVLWMEKVSSTASQRLFGSHAFNDGGLSFTPASPLDPGAMYHVVFVPPGVSEESTEGFHAGFGSVSGKHRLELIHQVPEPLKTVAPVVRSVHPSTDVLPANHLKFYITFSSAMEQGVFMDRIKLLRGDGSEIAGPFRETELWSPDGRRLTVWLHPGRQKAGVNLNEDEGPVLRENDALTLVVSGEWRATNGQKLAGDFKRTFRVGKPDHEQVDPARWMVLPPAAGSRAPLRITFPEPLDWALLQNSISVEGEDRKTVGGEVEVADGEREWRLVPAVNWRHGEYHITINSVLEDLAGNNLDRPFEVDVAGALSTDDRSTQELHFRVGTQP